MGKGRLYIRADGSTEMGLGHLVRSVALGEMLSGRFEAEVVCKEVDEDTKEMITGKGFGFQSIDSEIEFLEKLKPKDMVVLDGYQFDLPFQQAVKDRGVLLICIDDLCDREFAADLILNHGPGVSPSDYRALPETCYGLGPDYALLRPPFLRQAAKERSLSEIDTVLICFGGSDAQNLTLRAVEVALRRTRLSKILVVTGSSYRFSDELDVRCREEPRIERYQAVDADRMLELMLRAQLSVVPASGILYEVFTSGSKIISGWYVENQKRNYKQFRQMSAFVDAGRFSRKKLEEAFEKAERFIPKKVIDGRSPERIIRLIEKIRGE